MRKFNKLYKEILENNVAGGAGSVFNSGQIQAGQYGNQFPSQNDQAYAPGDARLPYSFFGKKKKKKSKKIKIQRRNLVENNITNNDPNYNYGFPLMWRAVKSKGGFKLYNKSGTTLLFNAVPYGTGWKISNYITDEYFKDKGTILHREDGPAMVNLNNGRVEYFINGQKLTHDEFLALQKVNDPADRDTMKDLLGV